MNMQLIKLYSLLLLTMAILVASFLNGDVMFAYLLNSLSVICSILFIHNMSNQKINKYGKNKTA